MANEDESAVATKEALVANDADCAVIKLPFIFVTLAIYYTYCSYQSLLGLNFIVHQLVSVVLW